MHDVCVIQYLNLCNKLLLISVWDSPCLPGTPGWKHTSLHFGLVSLLCSFFYMFGILNPKEWLKTKRYNPSQPHMRTTDACPRHIAVYWGTGNTCLGISSYELSFIANPSRTVEEVCSTMLSQTKQLEDSYIPCPIFACWENS